jgi:hypothetical protein
VLMHDIHGKTVDMVKLLVPRLRAKGFSFVRLTASPTIARARDNGVPSFGANQCLSGTRFQVVNQGVCVQSSHDRGWKVCSAGEWTTRTDATQCSATFPL